VVEDDGLTAASVEDVTLPLRLSGGKVWRLP